MASADPYSGKVCASIAVSSTTVNPGESITVTGKDFKAGSAVHLTLYPQSDPSKKKHYPAITASSGGTFTDTIVLPSTARGNQVLVSDGIASGCPADPIQIDVLGAGSSASSGGSSTPPAVTGVDIALLTAIAAALVGAGVVFTRGGRQRRRAAHS
jgi:hypothetical protein